MSDAELHAINQIPDPTQKADSLAKYYARHPQPKQSDIFEKPAPVATMSELTDTVPPEVLGNCVKYARLRCPSLPFGLYTLADKKNIINTRTPKPGDVAIIYTGNDTGHVAYVEDLPPGEVKFSEANWGQDAITTRTISLTSPTILGYFTPTPDASSSLVA